MKNLLGGRFFFLIRPPQPPQPPYPLCNPPQYTNFANFGPIWMKLGVEVVIDQFLHLYHLWLTGEAKAMEMSHCQGTIGLCVNP